LIDSFFKRKVLALQEFTELTATAFLNAFSAPRYYADTIAQMDIIGVGSLSIVLLTGFFTGAILALQTYRTLQSFGEVDLMGEAVAISLVRELGPVLTALVVAGRNSSGIASEIGSMLVSEQIDALRALGTDPSRKLVTPRVYATLTMLPLLTILSDFVGLLGGYLVSFSVAKLTTPEYWTTAYQSLTFRDVTQGLMKPIVFGAIIALVGCYFGLKTEGGTQGVGRATTQAVVVASVLIILIDFFIGRFLIGIHFA
jgi:phospholipid/cholesterol/gamma-HCH transport system permease protein